MTNAGVCSGDEQSAHVVLLVIVRWTAQITLICLKEPHRAGTTDRVWSDH